MRLAARGAREDESGGLTILEDPVERRRLQERATLVWVRSGLLATVLTLVATGLLLLR